MPVDPSLIVAGGSAILGAFSSNKAAKAANEANALAKDQYEWDKAKEEPSVFGANAVLHEGVYEDGSGTAITQSQYEALSPDEQAKWTFRSQFQTAADKSAVATTKSQDVAQEYLDGVDKYRQAGETGVDTINDLANLTPEEQFELSQKYAKEYGEGAYNLAADDINRNADAQARANARQQGRFGALSSQSGRKGAYIDQGRTRELLTAAERAKQVGYDRSQAEYARRQGLASTQVALGSTGLSNAASASALADSSYKASVNNPFAPYNAYNNTVSGAPSASLPNYVVPPDPFATGAGIGLSTWAALNK